MTPEPGLDPDLEGAEGRTWVVLQFQGEGPGERVRELDQYDIEVAGHLTWTTVTAGVPGSQIEDLADEEAVRAVLDVDPAWKRSPAIDAAVEEGVLGPDTRAEVTVLAFEPLDDPRLTRRGSGEDLEYTGDLALGDVEELQQDPLVRWITYSPDPDPLLGESRRLVGAPGDDTPTASWGSGAQWAGGYPGNGFILGGSGELVEIDHPGYRGTLWIPRSDFARGSPDGAGYTGSGVTVGVVDTGFETSHPHFDGVRTVNARDFLDDDNDPTGPHDHGTHVAGTITGSTRPGDSDVAGLDLQGVAPASDLVVSRAIQRGASATGGPTDWFDDVISRGDVEVISNSWGAVWAQGNYTQATKNIDEWVRDNPDTLLVFANGNAPRYQYTNGWGRGVNTLTVSAVNGGSTGQGSTLSSIPEDPSASTVPNTHETSPLLTRMNPPWDVANAGVDQVKPELLAPGEGILAPSSNDGYSVFRGTSMATPHVSGVAALLEDVTDDTSGQDLTANQMRALLVEHATPSKGGSGSYYTDGFGVVYAHGAMFNTSYEAEDGLLSVDGGIHPDRAYAETIQVPDDATRVSATLSWMDPTMSPSTTTLLRNGFWLVLGPRDEAPDRATTDFHEWHSSKWVNPSRQNVKQLVFEDPQPGEWIVAAYPRLLSASPDQGFDIAYTVETEEPGIEAEAVGAPITHRGEESITVPIRVEGTGAPAAGVHATVASTEDPLKTCAEEDYDRSPWGAVLGTVSQGRRQQARLCLHTGDLPYPVEEEKAYEVEVEVAWVGGSETLRFDVRTVAADPPGDVGTLRSPTHETFRGSWTQDARVEVEWDEVADADLYWTAVTDSHTDEPPLDPKPWYIRDRALFGVHPHVHDNETVVVLGPPDNPALAQDEPALAELTPDDGEEVYYIYVRPQDEDGNLAEYSRDFYVRFDIEEPHVELELGGAADRPLDDQPYVAPGGEEVDLYAQDVRDGGQVAKIVWKVEHGDGTGATVTETWSTEFEDGPEYNDPGLEDNWTWENSGRYEVSVTVHDAAGNTNTTSHEIVAGSASGSPAPGAVAAALAVAVAAGLARRSRRP